MLCLGCLNTNGSARKSMKLKYIMLITSILLCFNTTRTMNETIKNVLGKLSIGFFTSSALMIVHLEKEADEENRDFRLRDIVDTITRDDIRIFCAGWFAISLAAFCNKNF